MRCQLPIAMLLVVILLGSGSHAESLSAGENYALLVGVGDYDVKELRPLKYTRADVLALQERLLASGFDAENVVLMHDDLEDLVAHYRKLGPQYKPRRYLPQGGNIRVQLKLLLGRLGRDDSVVVAFSGHGVQFRNEKTSYFCPVDAKLEKKDSLIAFDDVFAALEDSQASRRLLLVDACQNDPLTSLAKSRQTVDLESTTRPQDTSVPEGIIALFSCRAGQKSFEMPELGHGVFFHHLLEAWDGKGDLNEDGKLSYLELAAYTRRETAEYAAVKLQALQTPQLKADFSGEWVLREMAKLPPLFDSVVRARTAEEAKASQAAWAKHLGKKVVETNSIGMKLTLIPPGEYLMGSAQSAEEASRMYYSMGKFPAASYQDEHPQHRVQITKPVYLGTTEVTQEEWKAVMGTEPWKGKLFVKEASDCAATFISWQDAREFCRRLSAKEGGTYRLPTEAEWEYACRAGSTTPFYYGEDVGRLKEYAWFRGNALDIGEKYAHEVGRKKPNAWGLLDMHGNVMEWCVDSYDESYYGRNASGTAIDPRGPSTESLDRLTLDGRVTRDGAWGQPEPTCRSSRRGRFSSDSRSFVLGFRVARESSSR